MRRPSDNIVAERSATMRLFTGIEIPPPILEKAEALLERLRPAARIQWSPIANLHITTKFIGEWPEERLAILTRELTGVRIAGPLPIRIGGLGFFPNEKSPRVFWAGVHAPPPLAALASETDRALTALGIQAEKRDYSPHLTLARIKNPTPLIELKKKIALENDADLGSFEAAGWHLYLSKTSPAGSSYKKLATFEFVY